MKIVTKNYSLQNGKRSYLVYLKDDNDKSIECFDLEGNDKRLEKENELSEKYTIDTENITYFSLQYKILKSIYRKIQDSLEPL